LSELLSTALFSVNDATASPPSNALYKAIPDFAKCACNWKAEHWQHLKICWKERKGQEPADERYFAIGLQKGLNFQAMA